MEDEGVFFHDSLAINHWRMYLDGDLTQFPSQRFDNLPSGTHAAAWVQSSHSFWIDFNPPVRKVQFHYSSWTAIPALVLNSFGFLVDSDTLPANCTGAPGCTSMDVWTPVTFTSATDNITRLRFDEFVWIDNLTITRSIPPPTLQCGIATRGSLVSCQVDSSTSIDFVSHWRFDGVDSDGAPVIVVDSPRSSLSWSGTAVTSGTVEATVYRNGSSMPEVAAGSLKVIPRPWQWDQLNDWSVVEDSIQSYLPWGLIAAGGPIDFGYNLATTHCSTAILTPDPHDSTALDPFALAPVDSGPNRGLWYVESVSWRLDRITAVHPGFDTLQAPRRALIERADVRACRNADLRPRPGEANFPEYNTKCKGVNTDTMRARVLLHEGYGLLGRNALEPNGHQARIEQLAQDTLGDPVFRSEGLVKVDSAPLWFRAWNAGIVVNDTLVKHADFGHVFVTGNWCNETIWVYDLVGFKYLKLRFPQDVQCL